MGRKKQNEQPDETAKEQEGADAGAKPDRKYRVVGLPATPRVSFPALQLTFRPDRITDDQIERMLRDHPSMARHFPEV